MAEARNTAGAEAPAEPGVKGRFVRLGWHDHEYFIYDRKYGHVYGFIYEAYDDDIQRVAEAYDKGQFDDIARNEPIDIHYPEDLPRSAQRIIEEIEKAGEVV